MRLPAVSGSLRRDSHNTDLLRARASSMPTWLSHTANEAFDGDTLIDDEISAALGVVVEELVDLAGQRSDLARVAA